VGRPEGRRAGDPGDGRLPVTRYVSRHFPPIVDRENIDWDSFAARYDEVQRLMRIEARWFEDGQNYNFRPAESRHIALGRNQFYVQFADFLFEKYGTRFYLLDYMSRLEAANGIESLAYYISTADLIHINLEGVGLDDLRWATVGFGRRAEDKDELGIPYATAWEINYVFHAPLLDRTWFHTGSALRRRQVYRALGHRVPLRRILDDNARLREEYLRENEGLEELPEEPAVAAKPDPRHGSSA
jgi:hypothetical protein